ncbi:hypothetical protein ABPG75_001885 [Micractinium tetrahymenae]
MARSTAIYSLPDELLGRIFELVNPGKAESHERAALPAVCRHWRAALFSSPAVWQELNLFPYSTDHLVIQPEGDYGGYYSDQEPEVDQEAADSWLTHKRCLLQRVGHLVRRLDAVAGDALCSLRLTPRGSAAAAVTSLSRLPRMEQLTELHLQFDGSLVQHYARGAVPFPLLASIVAQSPALLSLTAELQAFALRPEDSDALAASLQQVPRLADMHLKAKQLSPLLLQGIARLPALTSLHLSSIDHPLPPAVHELSSLTGLRRLTLRDSCIAWALLPAPCLGSSGATLHGLTIGPEPSLVLRAISACPSAEQLLRAAVPPGWQPTKLPAETAHSPQPAVPLLPAQGQAAVPLSLHGCTQLAAAQVLSLSGFCGVQLAPAVLSALRQLALHCCAGVAVHPGAVFPALRSLSLGKRCTIPVAPSSPGAELSGALLALVPAAPLLQKLSLEDCFEDACSGLRALPPAPGLTSLQLCNARELEGLPAGTYLSSLQELHMPLCELQRLPPALAAATALRSLDVTRNPKLQITSADVDATLAPLRQLTTLRLDRWDRPVITPETAVRLFRAMPQLAAPYSWNAP